MHPPIFITGKTVASRIMASPTLGAGVTSIISIGSGHKPPYGYSQHQGRRMHMVFDDVDVAQHPAGYFGCSVNDVERVIAFAQGFEGPGLVHCAAGISRSSASACVVYAVRLGDPNKAVTALIDTVEYTRQSGYRNDQYVIPNRRLIDLADRILGYGGVFLDVVLATFPYTDPYERIV